jgi:hypothetical protein
MHACLCACPRGRRPRPRLQLPRPGCWRSAGPHAPIPRPCGERHALINNAAGLPGAVPPTPGPPAESLVLLLSRLPVGGRLLRLARRLGGELRSLWGSRAGRRGKSRARGAAVEQHVGCVGECVPFRAFEACVRSVVAAEFQ